jgi:hypothetical protein
MTIDDGCSLNLVISTTCVDYHPHLKWHAETAIETQKIVGILQLSSNLRFTSQFAGQLVSCGCGQLLQLELVLWSAGAVLVT